MSVVPNLDTTAAFSHTGELVRYANMFCSWEGSTMRARLGVFRRPLLGRVSGKRGNEASRVQYLTRLRLEPLEDRRLLSVGSTELELSRTSSATFIANEGQWADDSVRYAFLGDGANVLHTDAGPVIQLFKQEAVADDGGLSQFLLSKNGTVPFDPADPLSDPENMITRAVSLSVTFDGAAAVEPVGVDLAETRYNFLLGEQDSWRIGVASYQTVAYPGLHDGIDLLTFGRRNSLKYEFHVAPGAD